MNTLTQLPHEKRTHSENLFWMRFRKNLIKELVTSFMMIGFLINLTLVSILGIILFINEFDFVKQILTIVTPPAFIFLAGKYLTLLPMYIVIPLACIPILSIILYNSKNNGAIRGVIGFIVISIIASLFLVFFI